MLRLKEPVTNYSDFIQNEMPKKSYPVISGWTIIDLGKILSLHLNTSTNSLCP